MARRIRVYEQSPLDDVVVVRHRKPKVIKETITYQPIYSPRARLSQIPDSAADASLGSIHRSVWHEPSSDIGGDLGHDLKVTDRTAYVRSELQDWL